MPVHRHGHTRASSVYAFGAELDGWWASRRDPADGAPAASPRIIVHPFEDLSDEASGQPFCQALVEELTATLSGFPDAAQSIGSDVGIDGRVRHDGARLQVDIQLTRKSDGAAFASFECVGTRERALAIHDGLARRVLENLGVNIPASRSLVRHHSFDLAAYDLYLMSRHYWNTRTLDGLRRSIALATQAVQRDPNYALAHAGLAIAYATLGTYTPDPPADAMTRGRSAALRALELDGEISDAHTALGFIEFCYDWSWTRADEAFRRATELNPCNATALAWHSLVHLVTGNDAAALRLVLRAEEIEPASLIIRSHVAWTLYFMRRFHEAVDRLERILQWDRRFWRVYFNVGWCYGQLGRHQQALNAMETCVALNDYPAARAALAHASARAGRVEEARRVVQELLTHGEFVSQYWLAVAYVALQDTSEALRCLQRAYLHREWFVVFLKREPLFDVLRSEPGFVRLTREIGL